MERFNAPHAFHRVGLTDTEVEKLLADPEQLLAIADMLTASQ